MTGNMMLGEKPFNADEHLQEGGDFKVIPPGWYKFIVDKSERKKTKRGDGEYIAMTLQIVSEQYKGRLIFVTFNIVNPSETAEKIARGQLSALCRAVGVLTPEDTTELHDIPFEASVGIKKGNDEYPDDQNYIKTYKAKEDKKKKTVDKSAITKKYGGNVKSGEVNETPKLSSDLDEAIDAEKKRESASDRPKWMPE